MSERNGLCRLSGCFPTRASIVFFLPVAVLYSLTTASSSPVFATARASRTLSAAVPHMAQVASHASASRHRSASCERCSNPLPECFLETGQRLRERSRLHHNKMGLVSPCKPVSASLRQAEASRIGRVSIRIRICPQTSKSRALPAPKRSPLPRRQSGFRARPSAHRAVPRRGTCTRHGRRSKHRSHNRGLHSDPSRRIAESSARRR